MATSPPQLGVSSLLLMMLTGEFPVRVAESDMVGRHRSGLRPTPRQKKLGRSKRTVKRATKRWTRARCRRWAESLLRGPFGLLPPGPQLRNGCPPSSGRILTSATPVMCQTRHQTIDLFGTEDLLGGPRFEHATEMLSYAEEDMLDAGGLRREQLIPIAASPVDVDLSLS